MIRIQNIYHMLAYAFQVLREQGYRSLATEEFANTAELCAEILIRGVRSQLKRGLGQEYVDRTEPLSMLRGKIEVSESLKARTLLRRQMVCSFDEFSVNTSMNQIVKASMVRLLGCEICKSRKKDLKKLLVYFADVDDISLSTVDWHMRFDRGNQTYRMLICVCWLLSKGLLQTQSDGSTKMMDFLDDQRMCRLYEKFIFEYYRREHPELKVSASCIDWVLDDGFGEMLPVMKSDIMLSRDGTVLIIDAKYYSHTMQQHFDRRSIHSSNLYQIFTYVKNKEAELAGAGVPHEVSGMLLYAKTDEEVYPDGTYLMSGNRISVGVLDLDQPFDRVRARLDAIVEAHFLECRKV